MSYTINAFWRPRYKWQLVDWFVGCGKLTRTNAKKMSKRQLFGKYLEERRKG